jgi:hypothetical protein
MDLGTTPETILEVVPENIIEVISENIIEVVPETIPETRSFSNIVFIDQNVSDYTLFLNNVNGVTLPIVYHSSTTREEILSLLTDFSHFDRIAFVFHGIYPGCYYDKPFLENQPYFTLDASRNVVVTENVTFIQTILNTYSVSHVDFLGCNLLLSKEWRDYFDLLGGFGRIVVGASNDNTGNLKYGGDWILENTMEDIRNVYFTTVLDSYSGLLVEFIYNLNRYYYTFYTYSASNQTVLTRSIYDNNKVLQSSFDISFGGQNVQTVLSLLDSGSGPYTLGLVDTNGNRVATDVAFCGLYSKALTTTQVQKLMTYVNTFKEPHTSATVYTVTVSGGVFNLNGTPQPNITFTSGLYVFDQSSSTNVGNTLVLGTTLDVLSSVVANNVVYSGTAGSLNAYTLIDFSGSNPASFSQYYFSSTTTGMGYLQIPSFTNMVLWLDASNVSLANNTTITTTNIVDKSPIPKSLLSVPRVTFQTNGLKIGYPGFTFEANSNSGMLFAMPSNTFLSSSSPHVGGMTVFFVINLISTGSLNAGCLISTTQSFFDFYGYRRIFYNGPSNQYINAPNYNSMNSPSIYYFTINVTSSGTTMIETLYTSNYNGTNYSTSPLTFTGTTGASNGNYDTYGKIGIGGRFQPANTADKFSIGGAISEVLIYNTKLETAKITQIVGYLRNKWSI